MSSIKNFEVKDEKILRENILLDIYFYEKELIDTNLRVEDKQYIKEKIEKAENIFKSI